MKATLSKFSICPCGFPILGENVPLWTVYEIEPADKKLMLFRCGGCKAHYLIEWVFVHDRAGGDAGYLPVEIFTTENNQPKETT